MPNKIKLLILPILFLLAIMPIASAHVEHAEPAIKSGVLYQIFLLHDWIHPLFFILMIYSCYYFRFFSGRNILHQPKACLGDCSNCYKPEGWLKQNHRYFFWGTLFLTFIHIGEISPSLNSFFSLSRIALWILISESSYLIFALLYLMTCYHFLYFLERIAKKGMISHKLYNAMLSFNQYHNVFFWLTVIMVALRFSLVAINTGSIVKAIPGTF